MTSTAAASEPGLEPTDQASAQEEPAKEQVLTSTEAPADNDTPMQEAINNKEPDKKIRGRPRKNPSEDESKPKRPRGRPKKSNEPTTNNIESTVSFSPAPSPPPLYATAAPHATSITQSDSPSTTLAQLAATATAATAAYTEANTTPNGAFQTPASYPPIPNNIPNTHVTPLTHARNHVAFLLANSPIYGFLLANIKIITASPKKGVVARLKLEHHHLNSKGSLHGSVTATIVDFMGGVAIACFDQRSNTGVSTDLHVSYLGKATVGQTIEIEGFAEKVGGTLAFTRIVVRTVGADGKEGDAVAMGRHTKCVKAPSAPS